ncbi:MAG TPA: hypothetical protein VLG91_04900 [Streptomyces sp.]|nr:hypothetical protein [Streptomyces sp.]
MARRGAGATRPPRRRPAQQHGVVGGWRVRPAVHRVRPAVQRVLDSMSGTPAFVLSGRGDILATNDLARALYAPVYADPVRPPNNTRFVFLDPQATAFFRDWDQVAGDCVAMLRAEAGRDLHDRRLTDLIGELSTRSEEFRHRWAAHNVRMHTTGVKLLHHPVASATSTCRSRPSRSAATPARSSSPTDGRPAARPAVTPVEQSPRPQRDA